MPADFTIADGSAAATYVETHITQGACAYPITPSTPMGVGYQLDAARGRRNLWDEPLVFLEPESEHSSASACEGFALAGGRVTNFTSGQGLILMKEVLYVISGKRLPIVFHVGARALTSQALNVHAGHDDIMGVADVGWGMLFARNAQDVADLALIARRVAEETATPFFVVQDGFLTTHTVENLELPPLDFMRDFVGAPADRLGALFDPEAPLQSGVVQNQDAYMKGKIAQRFFTDRIAGCLQKACDDFAARTGRLHGPLEFYHMDDAEYAIVGMGSLTQTACATVDWLRRHRGIKVGVVAVTSFRPFPSHQIVDALCRVNAYSVIERLDHPLSQDNPLATEIKAAFAEALSGAPGYRVLSGMPCCLSGSAGLGSRDLRPADFIAVVENMRSEQGRRHFVLNVRHPMALETVDNPDVMPTDAFTMRGHSIGGFGSVTTNKVIASIVGELFGLNVQAYPLYGSEKKGLPTTYYLAMSREPIRTYCEFREVDFVPLNDVNAFNLGNPLLGLKPGGMVFLQTAETDPQTVWNQVPTYARRLIARDGVRVVFLDTAQIARDESPNAELRTRMQGIVLLGVFLRYLPLAGDRTPEALESAVDSALRHYFGKRGEAVVAANLRAAMRGWRQVREVPRDIIAAEPAADAATGNGYRVSDRMHVGVIACSPDTPLLETAVIMDREHISAVVVQDKDGHAVGVVSKTDLANLDFISAYAALPPLRAGEVMSSPVLAVRPDAPLGDAMKQLREHKVHRLVVTEPDGKAVGILSVTDVVKHLAELAPAERN
jgi:pyruvate-ferredoxin/flavodoxin oxidoreductase